LNKKINEYNNNSDDNNNNNDNYTWQNLHAFLASHESINPESMPKFDILIKAKGKIVIGF
jgi:hypothetical protein